MKDSLDKWRALSTEKIEMVFKNSSICFINSKEGQMFHLKDPLIKPIIKILDEITVKQVYDIMHLYHNDKEVLEITRIGIFEWKITK